MSSALVTVKEDTDLIAGGQLIDVTMTKVDGQLHEVTIETTEGTFRVQQNSYSSIRVVQPKPFEVKEMHLLEGQFMNLHIHAWFADLAEAQERKQGYEDVDQAETRLDIHTSERQVDDAGNVMDDF